jgi:hypothetical protein
MTAPLFVPHIELLLQSLRISRERLASRSKVAIDTRILRTLLQTLASQMPFDADFYISQNADVAAAHKSGQITDLHRHFVESGFLEGRMGASPPVDEAFYAATYKDIAPAIRRGDIASGADHYIRSGAAEGRVPSEDLRPEVERWLSVLRD